MAEPGEIYQRMAEVLAALSFIPKERSQGVSYEFRSIDALMNVLHGQLAEHGLFLSPRVLEDWQVNMIPGKDNKQQGQALFRVCADVYASDGSWVTLGPGMAQSHDYGDKAVYQAQQNAIKYLLLEAFCIPTAEQDMDGRTPDAPPAVDLAELETVIGQAKEAGVEVDEDSVRGYAAKSDAHRDKAMKTLFDRISALDESTNGQQPQGEGAAQ